MNKGKSFEISRHLIFDAYREVKANKGAGGIDGLNIEKFEENLKDNLYKLWNRMSSGCYFPKAVRGVEIPKKNGKKRLLGIPTVEDRIAQMAVRKVLESRVEPIFLEDSYGYRPNKSAINAIEIVRERCWKYHWVVEFDIVGLFDNIDHEFMMKLVELHTENKWVILYTERFLKAPIQMPNGEIKERTAGTPQGGVISPVLANLFLHYAFDKWMDNKLPVNPWTRYADDGVVHCKSKIEAEKVLEQLKERMTKCRLEIHPEKTRIIYCGNATDRRHKENMFDFLGYTFRKRGVKTKYGTYRTGFTPAVSNTAKKSFKDKIREVMEDFGHCGIETLVYKMNPIIRGWGNYFNKFTRSEAEKTLRYVNLILIRWLRRKYKRVRRGYKKAKYLLSKIAQSNPTLFYHWRIGLKPAIG